MSKRPLIEQAIYTQRYVYRVHYQLIWTTFARTAIFKTPALQQELKTLLLTIAKRHHVTLQTVTIQADAVILDLQFAPQLAPVNVIKALKGRSAYWLLRQHPDWSLAHVWAPTYYFGTGQLSAADRDRYLNDPVFNS